MIQLSDHLSGVQDAVGIEGGLDAAHELHLPLPHAVPQEGFFCMPDAVLAADLAAHLVGGVVQLVHDSLDFFLPFRFGQIVAADVDMQVAVPGVAKGADANAHAPADFHRLMHKLRNHVPGHHHVAFVHGGGAALDGLQERAPGVPNALRHNE